MSLLRFVCPREIDLGHFTDREFHVYYWNIVLHYSCTNQFFTTFLPFAGITSRQQLLNLIFKAELIFLQK